MRAQFKPNNTTHSWQKMWDRQIRWRRRAASWRASFCTTCFGKKHTRCRELYKKLRLVTA